VCDDLCLCNVDHVGLLHTFILILCVKPINSKLQQGISKRDSIFDN
jgi:hypothetical protein